MSLPANMASDSLSTIFGDMANSEATQAHMVVDNIFFSFPLEALLQMFHSYE